ncbi:hypothetical protein BurJ1DRAFT_0649 [Burkholderiales bacterium JOSHI_001]|nr:hypothetical protein BurJ1DRAFT_0649 [Burkholderiales bacterium JOSHI_001]
MKTDFLHLPSDSRVGNTRTAEPGHADYVSLEATRALLSSSLAARSARLAADDMVSTDEAAELASTSRVTVNAWIAKGRCIGLSQTKRGFRLPRWQFEPLVWPLVPKLAAALGTTEGWALLAFLETPHGALGGVTPRAAIEQGQGTRVLGIAEQEGN